MSSQPPEQWNLLSEDRAYSGWITIVRRTFKMPDGEVSDWDIIKGSRTVAIVARTAAGEFLMVRQYRPGPMDVFDELPGGYARSGETVEHTAARELLEETGYRPASVQMIGSTWMTANSSVQRFVALAEGCTRVSEPNFDRDEFGEVLLVDTPTFIEKVRRGQLTDQGVAYRVLDHLGLLA
jgi:ADP-ribose pyrophosphatase